MADWIARYEAAHSSQRIERLEELVKSLTKIIVYHIPDSLYSIEEALKEYKAEKEYDEDNDF